MSQPAASHNIRAQLLYSGQVQGVGFRYTVLGVAKRFAVTGYVRNLSDGRVKLVAEGRFEEVEGLLAAVADRMGDLIHDVDRDMAQPTGKFASFEIRR